MKSRAFAGDRIVLFTLVDLLLQIIFCGFLLFAANRASNGEIQDKIARLAQAVGLVSVTNYVDATSRLVAIADLGKIDVVRHSDKSTALLDEATAMLKGLSEEDLSALSGMDEQQRRAFMKMYAALAPADRQQLSAFIGQYGIGIMKAALAGGMTSEQLRSFLNTISRLPAGDRKKFVQLSVTFANADPAKRQKIVDATAEIVKPPCFGRKAALHITEVSGGYLVRPLIEAVVPDVARALSSGASVGQTFHVSESAFSNFGSAVAAAHPTCYIQVDRDSQTYDERQLLKIQRWFGT
jgi:hypothetical protein